MVTDSSLVIPRATRPVSFTGLMTLYESNYVRLSWLVANAEKLTGCTVSSSEHDLPLFLSVLEQTRYTTTLHLTYYFREGKRRIADPDLTVRVYHDARLAEAMSCAPHHRHEVLRGFDTSADSELRRRWARNVLLNKWLEYCAEAGHGFEAGNALAEQATRQ